MRNVRKYWEEVRALEQGLPQFVRLTPAKGSGELVEVSGAQGAKLLHGGTHRRANEEEIAAHQGKIEAQRRQMFLDDLRRKGVAVVPLTSGSVKLRK